MKKLFPIVLLFVFVYTLLGVSLEFDSPYPLIWDSAIHDLWCDHQIRILRGKNFPVFLVFSYDKVDSENRRTVPEIYIFRGKKMDWETIIAEFFIDSNHCWNVLCPILTEFMPSESELEMLPRTSEVQSTYLVGSNGTHSLILRLREKESPHARKSLLDTISFENGNFLQKTTYPDETRTRRQLPPMNIKTEDFLDLSRFSFEKMQTDPKLKNTPIIQTEGKYLCNFANQAYFEVFETDEAFFCVGITDKGIFAIRIDSDSMRTQIQSQDMKSITTLVFKKQVSLESTMEIQHKMLHVKLMDANSKPLLEPAAPSMKK